MGRMLHLHECRFVNLRCLQQLVHPASAQADIGSHVVQSLVYVITYHLHMSLYGSKDLPIVHSGCPLSGTPIKISHHSSIS